MSRITALLLSLLLSTYAQAKEGVQVQPCEGERACSLGARSYHVMTPDGWDGQTPLPVLLHFHGWSRTGIHAQRSDRIGASTRRRGVLLVTPNGRAKTWDFWRAGSGDTDFADAVLREVSARYPIDPARIYVSGYSYGSAMAWRYACESGNDLAALLAVAGSIDQRETCREAPREVRHVHGVADRVMDFPMGPGEDTSYPVALWRGHYGCTSGQPQGDWQAREFLTLSRTAWECENGKVTLDLHPGGHFVPHGWIGRQLDELLGLPPSYP